MRKISRFGTFVWLAMVSLTLTTLAPFQIATANTLPDKLVGHGGPIKAISVSSDGKRALTASFDYSIIYWDISAREAKIIRRMIGHDSAVNDVVFVPYSDQAISVSDDGSLGIWDLTSGKLVKRFQSEPVKVLDVAVSADGRYAADARWDGTVRLYDLQLETETAVLTGHRGNVNAVAFATDGSALFSAAYDGQIIEWQVPDGEMLRPLYRHGWGINSITTLEAGRLIFGALDGTVGVLNIAQTNDVVQLAKRERPIQTVKASTDGKMTGFGDGSGRIAVFRADTLAPIEKSDVTYGPVWDFDFVAGTSQLFHVGLDDFAIRWQISPRKISRIESKFPRRFQVTRSDDPGELEFRRKCSVCHTLTPDDANRAGPTLHGVFGRKAGTLPGYAYSRALLDSSVIWNEKTIARLFDDGPDVMVPGTKMPIQRLKSVERRDDLIRYLKEATASASQDHEVTE